MTFKDRLFQAQKDLNAHKRDKDELLAYYINARLTNSIEVYYKELNDSLVYLYNKNPKKVIKKLKEEDD